MQAMVRSIHAPLLRESVADDVDAHTAQLGDWKLQYDQLDCGTFHGRFTDVRWPGMQLFSEETTRRVHQRGQLPANSIALACVLAGEGDVYVAGRRQTADVTMAVHAADVDTCTPAGCVLAGLVFDSALLKDLDLPTAQVDHLLGTPRMFALCLSAQQGANLRALLRAALETARQPAGIPAPQHLRDDLLLKAVEVLSQGLIDDHDTMRMRKNVVDCARDVLLASAHDLPSLIELSKRLGVSPRKLSYCFEDVLGISPARYVKMLRLNAVRRELRSVDSVGTTIYDVAARWGFWHFGHFSADFKRMFAELPSETLRVGRSASRARCKERAATQEKGSHQPGAWQAAR